jgi:hypothetical protein
LAHEVNARRREPVDGDGKDEEEGGGSHRLRPFPHSTGSTIACALGSGSPSPRRMHASTTREIGTAMLRDCSRSTPSTSGAIVIMYFFRRTVSGSLMLMASPIPL